MALLNIRKTKDSIILIFLTIQELLLIIIPLSFYLGSLFLRIPPPLDIRVNWAQMDWFILTSRLVVVM